MNAPRVLFVLVVLGALTLFGCRDDRVIAPDEELPPVLAIDRPTVQLFRFARGQMVVADTVHLSNNGEGPLGLVEQVGGVEYITPARTGWLHTEIINFGDDEALLVLVPTYAEDEQDAADIAEVVLKAQKSPDLKRVQVIARTLRGASFEFSVSPLAFAAVPGDPEMSQLLTVRNGGNGTLQIHEPSVQYVGADEGWLSLGVFDPSPTSPTYVVQAQPGNLGGGLFQAYLVFDSPPTEETRAKTDSVLVQLNIGKPVLATSTAELGFSVVKGDQEPPAQTIAISNAGEGPFGALGTLALGQVAYGEEGESWLNLALAENRITVSVTSSGMEPGDYQASFPVESENGGSHDIGVDLSVEAPILTANQRAVAFGMMEGDTPPPPPQAVGLSNTGAGPFEALGAITLGSFSPSAPWVSAVVIADTVVLTPTPASTGLASGDYASTLPIQSENGGSDAISVTLSVSRGADPAVLSLSATQVGFSAVAGGPDPASQSVQISNAGGQTLGALSLGSISYGAGGGWLNATLSGTRITLAPATGPLGDGTYTATVPVRSENGGNSSIKVTFTVGSPILTASSTSASFSAVEGGGNPSDQTITLSNTGPGDFSSLGTISLGTVNYIPGGNSWLSPSLAGNTLTMAVAVGTLAAGTYSATLPVNSTGGGDVSIAVSFTVTNATAPADLIVSPASVWMDAVKGGSNPPSQTAILSNAGGGTLGALSISGTTYGAGASDWLSASLVGTTLTLDAATGTLASGSYTATVNLSSANGGNAAVGVTFTIGSPVLTLSSASASFSGVVGGSATPASTSVNLSNTGSGDFSDLGAISVGSIVYGSGSGWLAATLGAGGNQVDLTPTLGSLASGTYTATVPVNSAAGGSGSIAATLTVAPTAQSPVLAVSTGGVSFSAVEGGGDPSSVAVTLFNSGGGDFAALGTLSLGSTSYAPTGTEWLSSSLSGNSVTLSPNTGALSAAGGPYSATVPVQSTNGGTRNITVTFNIVAAAASPVLAVSPTSVRVDAVTGGSDPANQDVLIYNAGDGSLGNISVGDPVFGVGSGWLASSKVSSTARLSFDISGLTANTYTADVPISTNDPADGTANIAVTLVVSDPDLTLSTTSAEFSGQAGGAASPGSTSVLLSNTGAGTFSDLGSISLGTPSYGPGATGWLSAGLSGGDTQVDLSAAMGATPAGTYSASVQVSSDNGGSGTIGVALTVTPAPVVPDLALSASSVGFTAVLGGSSPSSKTVNISNAGGGTVGDLGTLGIGTISYGAGATDWLSTSTISGSTLILSPVTGSLTGGTYTATVPVTSQFGGNESVSVTVDVGAPHLTASTRSVSFSGLAGGAPPADQTVTFSNTGVGSTSDLGTLNVGPITYGAGASGWLGESLSGTTLTLSADQTGISSGNYKADLTVTSQYGGSEDLSVTLSVARDSDPPVMILSSTSQRFDALLGAGNPASQTINVSNAGGGTLGLVTAGPPSYGAGASGWLSSSVSGNTITTSVTTGSLSAGTYSAGLPVSSNGGDQTVTVTLVVGTSRITLSPRTVTFGDTVSGTGPSPVKVAIANTGGGAFADLGQVSLGSTLYGEGASGWLTASLVASDTVKVQAFTGDLEEGTVPYQAKVPVMAEKGGTDTIRVSFTISPGTIPPSLSLSHDTLTFPGILGGEAPPVQTVNAYNEGGGELGTLSISEIRYEGEASDWLSGSVSGSLVSLNADADGTPGGTHWAAVTIASQYGGSRTLAVALDLAVPVLSLSSGSVTFADTVGSPDTLSSVVFVSNVGAGNRASLGPISMGTVTYPQGPSNWLVTEPAGGETVEGFQIGLKGSAAQLPEGTAVALVPVESNWGGADTVAVTFLSRVPDRSFDLPNIELVRDSSTAQGPVLVPLPGDSLTVGPVTASSTELGVRVKVRNGSATRVSLSGLRVGVPSYPSGQVGGWITGAFLNRTTATNDDPAELFIVIVSEGLPSGRHEGRLVISSESAGLEEVAPKVLRVVLLVD